MACGDLRVELVPLVGSGEPLDEAAVAHLPAPHEEVEVLRARPLSHVRSHPSLLSCRLATPRRYRGNRADTALYLCLTSRVLTPTARLLELLELLQAQPLLTGREIADRLGVDRRTARRYVAALQDLGIPIEGQRGVGGGYRIRPGFRLPPLMLTDDEAVVVALGTLAAGRLGLAGSAELGRRSAREDPPRPPRRPAPARRGARGDARLHGVARRGSAPVGGETVLLLAEAITPRRRLRMTYRSYAGEETERELSPLGLVVHTGRWYLAGVRPRPRRPAHVPRRPDPPAARSSTEPADAAARRLRRGRLRLDVARADAVALRGGGRARPSARGGRAPCSGDARRADRGRGGNAASDSRRLARLGRERARRPRLRLHDRKPDELRASIRALADRLAESA